jgi:hypothetical protein
MIDMNLGCLSSFTLVMIGLHEYNPTRITALGPHYSALQFGLKSKKQPEKIIFPSDQPPPETLQALEHLPQARVSLDWLKAMAQKRLTPKQAQHLMQRLMVYTGESLLAKSKRNLDHPPFSSQAIDILTLSNRIGEQGAGVTDTYTFNKPEALYGQLGQRVLWAAMNNSGLPGDVVANTLPPMAWPSKAKKLAPKVDKALLELGRLEEQLGLSPGFATPQRPKLMLDEPETKPHLPSNYPVIALTRTPQQAQTQFANVLGSTLGLLRASSREFLERLPLIGRLFESVMTPDPEGKGFLPDITRPLPPQTATKTRTPQTSPFRLPGELPLVEIASDFHGINGRNNPTNTERAASQWLMVDVQRRAVVTLDNPDEQPRLLIPPKQVVLQALLARQKPVSGAQGIDPSGPAKAKRQRSKKSPSVLPFKTGDEQKPPEVKPKPAG